MPVFMNRIRPIAHRVRRLTTRQNIAFVASALLGVAIVASAATGWQSLATALIGLTAMLALLASIQLRRRLAQNGHNLNVRMNDLAKRFDVAQRRILAEFAATAGVAVLVPGVGNEVNGATAIVAPSKLPV